MQCSCGGGSDLVEIIRTTRALSQECAALKRATGAHYCNATDAASFDRVVAWRDNACIYNLGKMLHWCHRPSSARERDQIN